jgi:SAM-dependent methyltransferase
VDCGCGVGVIGICAAHAVLAAAGNTDGGNTGGRSADAGISGRAAEAGPLCLRAQDRDELARIFTRGNALRNGLGFLQARTEPLLAGDETWDLILSNLPAKAGEPVLDDFLSRSAGLLAPGGRAVIVVVNSLAGFVRTRLNKLLGERGVCLVREGTEHQVFVYEGVPPPVPAKPKAAAEAPDPPLLRTRPFYLRNRAPYDMEGIKYEIGAVYGAAEFDRPDGAVEIAAALLDRLGGRLFKGPPAPVLVHEGGQGHFPLWFLLFLERNGLAAPELLLLHGRNVLALEAARANIAASPLTARPAVLGVPGVDLGLDAATLLSLSPARGFGFIAAFPRIVPQTDPYAGILEALDTLLVPGGAALISLPSSQADRLANRQAMIHQAIRLDRRKPSGFTRVGDLKRRGFRALLYC